MSGPAAPPAHGSCATISENSQCFVNFAHRRRRRLRSACRQRRAHVTLESREAPVGAAYKAVLRVPHGCDGSPTTAIRVRIPEGVIAVKPMPKPGWKLDTVTGKYPKTYTLARRAGDRRRDRDRLVGRQAARRALRRVRLHRRSSPSELAAGQTIYFPVVQECEKGVHRWIEIPAGKATVRTGTATAAPSRRRRCSCCRSAERRARSPPSSSVLLARARADRARRCAHASLVRAEPADGAVVAEAPAALRLDLQRAGVAAGDAAIGPAATSIALGGRRPRTRPSSSRRRVCGGARMC